MAANNSPIDIGRPGQWSPHGLSRLDRSVADLVKRSVKSNKHAAQTLRWYLLDLLTSDPVASEITDLEAYLQREEGAFWSLFEKKLRKGLLDDREVGKLIGYETDYPIKSKKWKSLREQVFVRIALAFAPEAEVGPDEPYDIGTAPNWRYDVIRNFNNRLRQMTSHHAATQIGAETLRWHILRELTGMPRPVKLTEVEQQLENAEASLMASFASELKRSKGHLGDDEVARMLGFRKARPVVEGYYRQLREIVYDRLAFGFGSVDLPEIPPPDNAIDIGCQGAWKPDALASLDRAVEELATRWAKTPTGAQTLRWALLDTLTADPEPVDMVALEQRVRNLNSSIKRLFGGMTKDGSVLSDSQIALFAGLRDLDTLTERHWRSIGERVVERIDDDVLSLP